MTKESVLICNSAKPSPQQRETHSALAPTLRIVGAGDATRQRVEAYIQAVYARRFGAHVSHFAPALVALYRGDECVAAAGYRRAAGERLFLEGYLDRPIDEALAAHGHGRPDRSHVVEVGHLAATRAGEGRRLIGLLGPHLAEQQIEWVVGTLTQQLRRLFVRMGIAPIVLGAADPAALGDGAVHWGTYYEHRPVVLAGRLDRALRTMSERAGRAEG